MKLKGILLKSSNTPTKNGDVYSDECLQNIAKQINERSLILGELSHNSPYHVGINTKNVVCQTNNAKYADGNLYVDIEILPTPMANYIPKKENGEYDLDGFVFGMRGYATINNNTINGITLNSIDLIKKDEDVSLGNDVIPFC
jgi:hypothetical protein